MTSQESAIFAALSRFALIFSYVMSLLLSTPPFLTSQALASCDSFRSLQMRQDREAADGDRDGKRNKASPGKVVQPPGEKEHHVIQKPNADSSARNVAAASFSAVSNAIN